MGLFSSSTQKIPEATLMPKHLAVIMDGNGRWARKRFLPRMMGHKKGLDVVRDLVKICAKKNIDFLTLFAFSSENWRRPEEEVTFLMTLFLEALRRETAKLHQNNVRLKLIGDMSQLSDVLKAEIKSAEKLTMNNTGLTLTIAANYGGRWDVMQAMNQAHKAFVRKEPISEEMFSQFLSMHYAPEPDLFIRTGGEKRISNFLMWQLAYTELYFTDTLWPDFDEAELELALQSYQQRERRFGLTSEQLKK